eukprot:4474313-Pyramimonas_sp.AAC.1
MEGPAHLVIRVFRKERCFSLPWQAFKSIIAGARRGVASGIFYLHRILETVYNKYNPAVCAFLHG